MLLPLDLLVAVYMHVISAMLLFGANVLSQSCVEEEIELFHNNGMGKGSLYDSHIDFMKTHLYDNKEDENEMYKERDTYLEIYSLPDFVTSILQPSPLIKRQVIQSTIFNILHNKDYYSFVSGREYLHFYLFTDRSMYVLYITVDVNILVFKFRGR